jgi:hypothetical protein
VYKRSIQSPRNDRSISHQRTQEFPPKLVIASLFCQIRNTLYSKVFPSFPLISCPHLLTFHTASYPSTTQPHPQLQDVFHVHRRHPFNADFIRHHQRGAPTEYNCSLRHLDGTVRVTVIALSVVIGLLAILLLWSCCAVPNKKKKVERTKMTVVKSFK